MNKINNTQKIILFMIFSFLIIPVNASINITFISDNEKVINVFDLDNKTNQISSNVTNEITELEYKNYNIKLYPSNTQITKDNGSFIFNNLNDFNNDYMLLMYLAIIIFILYLFFKIFGSRL